MKRSKNYLPYEGEVYYEEAVYSEEEAAKYLARLRETLAWRADVVTLFGKRHVLAREVAWYAEEGLYYAYAGQRHEARPWSPLLKKLKSDIERWTNASFDACLLNYYPDGRQGMGWHSDNEATLKAGGCIASLSLGAGRDFVFKHNKTGEKVKLHLGSGSLLLMQGATQQYWKHSLPKRLKVKVPRLNLTFRQHR